MSDGVSLGRRVDESGPAVADRLAASGFEVSQVVIPDERERLAELLRDLARSAELVVTTGGTGFAPRDVTPEATRSVIEREAPGLAEAMRAAGRVSTPFADLSRAVAGILGSSLILNLPGSPRGAVESLDAILPLLTHAIDHLTGPVDHA